MDSVPVITRRTCLGTLCPCVVTFLKDGALGALCPPLVKKWTIKGKLLELTEASECYQRPALCMYAS